MNGLELAIQALTGGITGYVTNTTAVKMIFKKVLGFGGLIIETREEFISNVSQLVERDIINHGTLQSELSKDEFKLEVNKIVNDFLQKQLYNVTENMSLGQIPQMPKSLNNLFAFLDEKQLGVVDEVLKCAYEDVSLQNILSEEQVELLVSQVIDTSLNICRETDILDSFISSIYSEYSEDSFTDLIPSMVFDTAAENLNKAMENFHGNLEEKFDQSIQQLVDNLYEQLDISLIVDTFEKSIKDKTLIELFGRTNAENVSKELLQYIIRFLKSSEGKKLLEQTSNYLFEILKETHMPLFSLFKPELAVSIESFLASKLPNVVNKFIMWLKENQELIENSIEGALKSTLEEESGLNSWMKNILYEQLASNELVSKFQVVDKIIRGIHENVDVRALSEEISLGFVDYLKNTNISVMLSSLETQGIFTSDDISLLIEKNLDKLVAEFDFKGVDSYFNKKLGDFVKRPFAESIEAYIKVHILKFKKEFLYTPKFTTTVYKEFRGMLQEVSNKKISDLISNEALQSNVAEYKTNMVSLLEKRRDYLVKIIVQKSKKFMDDKKLSDILNASVEDKVTKKIAEKMTSYTKKGLEEFQGKPIYSLYDRINAMPNMVTRISSGSIHLLGDNLEVITKGQIDAIVASNLAKLPNKQLQEVVEDFMGKELKPISWFGGFLGILAGFGFGLTKSRFNITGSVSLACSVPIYALVGYLTNKQALWMIFHPYHPWRVWGNDVPLTQGVIVKSKPRFAKSMACFVGEELLNPQSSVKLFKKNRINLSNIFMKSIAENNYQIVGNFLLSNKSKIGSELLKVGYTLVDKNIDTWSQMLVGELGNIELKAFDLGQLEEMIKVHGQDFPMKLQPYLIDIIGEVLENERPISQVLPTSVTRLGSKKIDCYLEDKLGQLQENISNQDFFEQKVIAALNQPFAILISKSLQELITEEQKGAVKNRVAELITEQLQSESNQKKVQGIIQDKILKELNPNKKIMNLFEGNLFEMLKNQVQPLLNLLTKKIIALLDKERENLKNSVKSEAKKSKMYVIANSILDIDSTIDRLVNRLVDETAPEIMSQSRKDLNTFLLESINNIGESQVDEIKIILTEQGIADMIRNFFENKTLNKHLKILSGGLIESVTTISLERMLGAAGIKKTEDVFKILALELDLLRDNLTDSLEKNQETIKIAIASVVTKILDNFASGISASSIFEGVSEEDIQRFAERILVKTNESKAYRSLVVEFAEAIVNYANTLELKKIIEPEILQNDFEKAILLLIKDEKTTNRLKDILEHTLEMLFTNVNDIFEIETKDYIVSLTVESILNSLEEEIADLVKTLDLSNITEREINNMEPKEIEELFNSFAKRYFRKLEYYGLWGGLLGFLMDILITRMG